MPKVILRILKIRNYDWSKLNVNSANECYTTFLDQYNEAVNKCIPLRKKSKYSNGLEKAIKTNPEVKKAFKHKHTTFAKMRACSDQSVLKKEFNKAGKNVKKLIKSIRREYENSIIEKCKKQPKLLFSYINSQKNCRDEIKFLKDKSGKTISHGTEITNCLNKQFSSTFTESNGFSHVEIEPKTSITCTMNEDDLSASKVQELLNILKTNKSVGVDDVNPMVLRKCSENYAVILSKIFQVSLKTGKLPKIWKDANVTPIFKGKGKKSDPSNYRPISLTAIPCKIMEKLVKNVMVRHLVNNNLICTHQHGFMRAKSCLTNLLECLDIITEVINRGFYVILIFLDFAKAFDSVDHHKLILKLKAFGFRGELLDWLIDFINDRRQRVIIGNSVSEWANVSSGVPQGSVLGPLLFLIFINEMPDKLNHICKLFADDSKLL